MINSDELRFFCVIASHSSLAAAARTLHVSAPSVTQRLQNLEDKLKIKLIDRSKRQASLTDEGAHLFAKAKGIVADIDELQVSFAEQKNEVIGQLNIQAPLGFGAKYIAPLIAQFQQRYPKLQADLELSDTPDFSADKAIDLIIHIGQLRDSSLKMIRLSENKRILCASPSYIARFGKPSTPADLKHHLCLALKENKDDATLWRFINKKNQKNVNVRITPSLSTNDGRVIKMWAMQGHGIMIRSEWDVKAEIKAQQLVPLLPDHELPSADIVALLGSAPRHRSARTLKFLDFLKAHLLSD